MLVIGFVFSFFMKEPVTHYYYYLFIGLLVWNFFSVSLAKATPSIVFERSLIKKAFFPRAIIPLSIILSNAINFIVAFTMLCIPILFLNTMSFTTIPLIVGASVLLFSITVGLSLLAASLNVRFRDVNFFVQALLLIWFYATPVIYSLTQMPRSLLWLWRINPLTSVLQLYQNALLGLPLPGPAMLMSNIGVAIIVLVVGVILFQKESKTFDDWV